MSRLKDEIVLDRKKFAFETIHANRLSAVEGERPRSSLHFDAPRLPTHIAALLQ